MQDLELLNLIRLSFLSDQEKTELERLLADAPDGGKAEVEHALEVYLEADIASRAKKFKELHETFDAACKDGEGALDAQKEKLEADTDRKLAALADDDFEARELVWREYDEGLERIETACDAKIQAAASALQVS